jgi:hypothetical protein
MPSITPLPSDKAAPNEISTSTETTISIATRTSAAATAGTSIARRIQLLAEGAATLAGLVVQAALVGLVEWAAEIVCPPCPGGAGNKWQPRAQAIEQGYSLRSEPYHGYFFKVLKGEGPDAPLGAMNFVVKEVMIGGFALVASPAEYGVTGVKTFIVSHDGVVYEKDFGPKTLDEFGKMERFNPDKSWAPVLDEDQ